MCYSLGKSYGQNPSRQSWAIVNSESVPQERESSLCVSSFLGLTASDMSGSQAPSLRGFPCSSPCAFFVLRKTLPQAAEGPCWVRAAQHGQTCSTVSMAAHLFGSQVQLERHLEPCSPVCIWRVGGAPLWLRGCLALAAWRG